LVQVKGAAPGQIPFDVMAGLSFAEPRFGQRVLGNKIMAGYQMPEGWGPSAPSEGTWKRGGGDDRTDFGMLVLQPDTSLDLKPSQCSIHTYVQMFKKTEELVGVLQAQSADKLMDIMGLSEKTAKSHAERFQNFHKLPPKQAALIFGGDKLRASEWTDSDQKYAEQHLRLVSGLYGVLRPFDDVKPVRDVPMNAKLATKKGSTVAEFWGDSLVKQLAKDALGTGGRKPLLILAVSDEYLKGLQLEALPDGVKAIRIDFSGGPESELKRARSQIGRWVIRKRINDADELRDFDSEDWKVDKLASTSSRLVFAWVGDVPATETKEKKSSKDKDKDRGRDEKDDKSKRRKDERDDDARRSSDKAEKSGRKSGKESSRKCRSASNESSRSRSRRNKSSRTARKREESPRRRRKSRGRSGSS